MRICAIGDPHGSLDKIRQIPLDDIDLILLTGDLGKADLARKMAFEKIKRAKEGLPEKEYSSSMKKRAYMQAHNSSVKIVKYLARKAPVMTIYGNVEAPRGKVRKQAKELSIELPFLDESLSSIPGVRIINNRVANFNGIRIGGLEYFIDTNWVRDFKPKDFQRRMASAKKDTEKAKRILKWFNQLDILITHQPPYGILDKVGAPAPMHWRGKHAGSKEILDYIKRKQPAYLFCGHIHEGEGKKKIGKTEVHNLGVASYKVIEF